MLSYTAEFVSHFHECTLYVDCEEMCASTGGVGRDNKDETLWSLMVESSWVPQKRHH